MTPEQKVALLKEAGVWDVIGFPGCIDKLIDLVAAHERKKLAEQEPFDMDDHPPHRLCECRKCMEYFTPLPDCDAFAASGKPIAEQPASQEYQDHLVNQSFDWSAMAAKHQFMEGYRIGLAEMREKCAKVCEEVDNHFDYTIAARQCAAAIRAIKFEGDTGFRPVSEMIAEHKQDPKKAAAIEKAKMRKAKQEPVAEVRVRPLQGYESTPKIDVEWLVRPTPGFLYAAPVRTKDLTDDEIAEACGWKFGQPMYEWVIGLSRAVIAAYKEKNK